MMKAIRIGIAGVALSTTMAASALAAGVDVNATTTGLALRGHDPVAYFTVGQPTKGDWRITATHNGATYRFASKENRAKFKENPVAYVPAFGGYCAFGTARGFKLDGDPNVWKIVDNKLFLNISKQIKTRWVAKQDSFIRTGKVKWADIKDKSPESLLQ